MAAGGSLPLDSRAQEGQMPWHVLINSRGRKQGLHTREHLLEAGCMLRLLLLHLSLRHRSGLLRSRCG